MAKLASLYTEDAVLMPPNTASGKGRAAIQSYFHRDVAREPRVQRPIHLAHATRAQDERISQVRVVFRRPDSLQPVDQIEIRRVYAVAVDVEPPVRGRKELRSSGRNRNLLPELPHTRCRGDPKDIHDRPTERARV